MPLTGNTPNLFIKPTQWEELRATLLGRRVELFQIDSNPEQWRKGFVAAQGLDPDKHPEAQKGAPDDDSNTEVGWLIAFDDGEVQWVRHLRGTPYVRFLSAHSVLASAEDGGSRTPSRQSKDGTLEAFNFGFGQEPRSSVTRSKGTDHEKSTGGPRFRADTVSSLLPEYANNEVDRIREAFKASNYASLEKLPFKLAPDAVAATSQEFLSRNLAQPIVPQPTHKSLKQHGLFHTFEYIPSPYSRMAELQAAERAASNVAKAKIAGGVDPFNGEVYYQPFNGHGAVSAGARGKYESAFPRPPHLQREHAEESVYPYMANVDADAQDAMTRAKWVREAKVLNDKKPYFVPSGKLRTGASAQSLSGHSLAEGPTRRLLPEVVKSIHACLVEDWSDANFIVTSDPEDGDAIQVRFEERSLDAPRALVAYMTTLATDNSQALAGSKWYSRYKLRRAPEAWGILNEEDGWRVFVFRPPWSKPQAPQDAYYALHPEKSTYRSSFPQSEPFVPTHGHAPSLMQRRDEDMEKPRSLSVIKHQGQQSIDEATAKLGLPVKDRSMNAASLSSSTPTSIYNSHQQASTLDPSVKAGDAASVAAASASGLAALRSL